MEKRGSIRVYPFQGFRHLKLGLLFFFFFFVGKFGVKRPSVDLLQIVGIYSLHLNVSFSFSELKEFL